MFSNAGLPLPRLLTATGCLPLGQGGFPSGMFPGATYDQHTVHLSPGDAVLFAAGGLHELCNQEGMELDDAQIRKIWGQCRDKSADEFLALLFDGVSAFSDGIGLNDDATAVILKVHGDASKSEVAFPLLGEGRPGKLPRTAGQIYHSDIRMARYPSAAASTEELCG